jgi:hypothetical protein
MDHSNDKTTTFACMIFCTVAIVLSSFEKRKALPDCQMKF